MTHIEAAKRLRNAQPKITSLLRSQQSEFSIDRPTMTYHPNDRPYGCNRTRSNLR
ncbi:MULTISPECIES: hypothetical protein [unclassified Microcoleus]|uniref:hypothetical protein n=1 Tax=unclassified Microcoleus TaxID=2642155 RepID=UPI002FCE69C4